MLVGALGVAVVALGVTLVVVLGGGDDDTAADPTGTPTSEPTSETTVESTTPDARPSVTVPPRPVDVATERAGAIAGAEDFVRTINTYGPDDLAGDGTLPGYAERVRPLLTDDLVATFDDNLLLAEQTVREAGYARSVEITTSGAARCRRQRRPSWSSARSSAAIPTPAGTALHGSRPSRSRSASPSTSSGSAARG